MVLCELMWGRAKHSLVTKKTVKVNGAWTEGKSKVRKRLNSCFRFLSLSLRPLPKTYDSTYSECYSLSLVHFVRYRTYYGWAKIYHIFGTNKKMRKLLLKRTFSLCRHKESSKSDQNQKKKRRTREGAKPKREGDKGNKENGGIVGRKREGTREGGVEKQERRRKRRESRGRRTGRQKGKKRRMMQ